MDNVEKVARALASADGLDWDEVCGVDDPATEGFCDSGTCIAAHWEDHDQEQARRWYLHLAQAAITALSTHTQRAVQAGLDAAAKHVEGFSAFGHVSDYLAHAIRALSAKDVAAKTEGAKP